MKDLPGDSSALLAAEVRGRGATTAASTAQAANASAAKSQPKSRLCLARGTRQVERHAPRHHVALHGIPVAGDLTALALQVTRDLGVWAKVHVSPSYVYVPFDESVHVNVPELGANVAFHGAFNLHVPETRVDVALYLPVTRMSPNPECTSSSTSPRTSRSPAPVETSCSTLRWTNHDIANEPLFRRVRGERQEYDETEDHDRDGKQG